MIRTTLWRSKLGGFTLVEVLTVMTLIVVLAGLTLGVTRYAGNAGKTNRARVEMKALELALEKFKVDNGFYPVGADGEEGSSDAWVNIQDAQIRSGANSLYTNLVEVPENKRPYLELKRSQYRGSNEFGVVVDPWGNPYGYTCGRSEEANPNTPSVTIWTTSGVTDTNKWLHNLE